MMTVKAIQEAAKMLDTAGRSNRRIAKVHASPDYITELKILPSSI